jgi:cytochrome b6-f complex iron-sulfur subunit
VNVDDDGLTREALEPPNPVSRRAAIRTMGLVLGGAAVLVSAEACGAVLFEIYGTRPDQFGGPITVGVRGDFPAASPQKLRLDKAGVFYREAAHSYIVHLSAETSFLLAGSNLVDTLAAESMLRDADGSYWLVLYQVCVHLGTKVAYLDSCLSFKCPSHGAHYHCDGEYLDGPAPRSMDRFPISFDGDRVIVDTGRINRSVARPETGTRLLAVPNQSCSF